MLKESKNILSLKKDSQNHKDTSLNWKKVLKKESKFEEQEEEQNCS